jgi:hypothetical protein
LVFNDRASFIHYSANEINTLMHRGHAGVVVFEHVHLRTAFVVKVQDYEMQKNTKCNSTDLLKVFVNKCSAELNMLGKIGL